MKLFYFHKVIDNVYETWHQNKKNWWVEGYVKKCEMSALQWKIFTRKFQYPPKLNANNVWSLICSISKGVPP
jgi:hypothetical protein